MRWTKLARNATAKARKPKSHHALEGPKLRKTTEPHKTASSAKRMTRAMSIMGLLRWGRGPAGSERVLAAGSRRRASVEAASVRKVLGGSPKVDFATNARALRCGKARPRGRRRVLDLGSVGMVDHRDEGICGWIRRGRSEVRKRERPGENGGFSVFHPAAACSSPPTPQGGRHQEPRPCGAGLGIRGWCGAGFRRPSWARRLRERS
jgi:hypothetical protein